jgi:protein ImuA
MPAIVAELRRRIGALEGTGTLEGTRAVSTGLSALDRALPWRGLPRGALHEILGTPGDGAALAFAALIARQSDGAVLWCRSHEAAAERGALYGPGLAALGLDPRRLLLIAVARSADVLWVMEEGLRSRALAAVVGEGAMADFTASRRLQLAAAETGTLAILMPREARMPTAALTRWEVASSFIPSPFQGEEKNHARYGWHITLQQCRGGKPGGWRVEANNAALSGAVALPLAHGPMEARAARA